MYTPPMGSGALTARNPERTDRARLSAVFAATQAGPARRTTLRHQGSPPTASSGWSTSPHSPRPHCLLLLRASVGPTPSEILCVDATHCMLDCGLRDLLLLAAAAAAGDCPRGGRGRDRLGPRRRPCLTALLCCASLTMPRPPPPCCYPSLDWDYWGERRGGVGLGRGGSPVRSGGAASSRRLLCALW
jgi:hypothetical protein